MTAIEWISNAPIWFWIVYGIIGAVIGMVSFMFGMILSSGPWSPSQGTAQTIKNAIIAALCGLFWPVPVVAVIVFALWACLRD